MLSFVIVFLVLLAIAGIIARFGLMGIAAAVGLAGSDTDSAGLMYWIINHFPAYKAPIRFIAIFGGLISVYRLLRNGLLLNTNRVFFLFHLLPLLIVSAIVVTLSVIRGQGLLVGFSELIWLGIPFFFLWMAGVFKTENDNLFIIFILLQGLLAMMIIIGGSSLADINGATYASKIGGEGWVVDPRDMINAPIVLFNFNKHDLSVMKFGHFHNPNSLGVYSVMLMVVAWYGLMKTSSEGKGKGRVALWVIPIGVAFILWMNSLTRGPIILLLVWVIVKFVGKIRKRKTIIALSLVSGIILVWLGTNLDKILLIRYLIVQPDDTSVVSRLGGYQFAFNAIVNHPFIGQVASPLDPVPHILTLKVAAYYGVPTAFFITLPFVHIIVYIVKNRMRLNQELGNIKFNYVIMILCVLFGAILTNGVVVYVMFWIAYAEILIILKLFVPRKNLGIKINQLKKKGISC